MRNGPIGNPVNLLEPNLLKTQAADHQLPQISQDRFF